jgi:BlaI family transcriptional regulator, penicillinase repressor
MAKRLPHITEAELRIMKLIWQRGTGTVRQVLDALPATGEDRPAYTTVMTLMKQLADKGALAVDRERQPFVYKPAVRRDQVFRHRVSQFLHEVFDGQTVDLVLRLVEDEELSAEQLRQIEAKVRQREQAERNKPANPGD